MMIEQLDFSPACAPEAPVTDAAPAALDHQREAGYIFRRGVMLTRAEERLRLAVILRGMRDGKSVSRVCGDNGWGQSWALRLAHKNKWYRKLVEKRTKPKQWAFAQAVAEYEKLGRTGLKSLAAKWKIGHINLRRRLIVIGIYKPEPTKKDETRPGSRYHAEWKEKLNKQKKIDDKPLRDAVAMCLRNWYRQGVPIETTARSTSFCYQTIWNKVRKNKVYRSRMAKRKADAGRRSLWSRRRFITRQWSNEKQMVESIVASLGVCNTEVRLGSAEAYVDIEHNETLYECKASTRSHDVFEAMGQCICYRLNTNKPLVLVFPADCDIRTHAAEALKTIGIRVMVADANGRLTPPQW